MRFLLYIIIMCCAYTLALAQDDSSMNVIRTPDVDSLKYYETRMQTMSQDIILGKTQDERITAAYYFARNLLAALKQPNSYAHPFDSLKKHISILYSPDNKFRIFTWNLRFDNDSFAFHGVIQMNRKELLLFGLYDKSPTINRPDMQVTDNKNWYGALYYKILKNKRWLGKTYYTLLGWDGYTRAANRKVIDVLTFDKKGEPKFGAPIFIMRGTKAQYRVIFEYSDRASMTVNYLEKEEAIVYDHMVPPDPSLKGKYNTYIPDGSYDYLMFKKGAWRLNRKLWDEIRNEPID